MTDNDITYENLGAEEKPERKKFTRWQKISLARNIISLVFYVLYLVYFLASGNGSLAVNIILAVSTGIYFILFVLIWLVLGRKGKRFTNAGKRVYKLTRKMLLLVNTFIVGGAIINLSAFGFQIMTTVCAVVIIVNFVFNVLWLVIGSVLRRRFGEQISTVKTGAKNAKAKITGFVERGKKAVMEKVGMYIGTPAKDESLADGNITPSEDESFVNGQDAAQQKSEK